MATYQITQPDGSVYEVDADTPELAHKQVKAHIQEGLNAEAKKSFDELPTWAKPFVAASDVGQSTLSRVSLGLWDKAMGAITGKDEEARTDAIRSRMGGAQYGADILAGLVTPTGVPGMVAKVGGGPTMRFLTGLLGGTAEGAAQGGVQAAIKGEGIVPATVGGAAGGAAGQSIAGVLSKGANAANRWIRGIDDSLPPPGVANIGAPGPSAVTGQKAVRAKQVEQAARDAVNAGGSTKAYQDAFDQVTPQFFPKDQRKMLETVTKGDLGTVIPGALAAGAEKAQNPLSLASIVLGAHSLPAGLTLGGANLIAAPILRNAQKSGTEASVEALRRATMELPAYPDLISPEMKARLAQGARRGLMGYYGE